MTFSDDQIQRILLEYHFVHTAKEICAKWGITPYRLRKWKKDHRCAWTLHDCIIAGVYRGGWHDPADLIGWLDYRDHAIYSRDQVLEMFEALEARGELRRQGDRWTYVQVEPPYLFGPRPQGAK